MSTKTALAVLLIVCSAGCKSRSGDDPNRVASDRPAAPAQTASDASTCDDYFRMVSKCVEAKIPEAERTQQRQNLENDRKLFQSIGNAAGQSCADHLRDAIQNDSYECYAEEAAKRGISTPCSLISRPELEKIVQTPLKDGVHDADSCTYVNPQATTAETFKITVHWKNGQDDLDAARAGGSSHTPLANDSTLVPGSKIEGLGDEAFFTKAGVYPILSVRFGEVGVRVQGATRQQMIDVAKALHARIEPTAKPDTVDAYERRLTEAEVRDAAALEAPPTGTSIIPLCAGLTIVTAVSSGGDAESIKTIESVTPGKVVLKYTAESLDPWWSSAARPVRRVTHYNFKRTVLTKDMLTAEAYQQLFFDNGNQPIPGTTAIGTSTKVLRELKMGQEIYFQWGGFSSTDVKQGADQQAKGTYLNNFSRALHFHMVEKLNMPVMVDDKLVQLPAIHATGISAQSPSEFYFLDDEHNPLALAFQLCADCNGPLNPATQKLCDDARDGHGSGVSMVGESCDWPQGGPNQTLKVIKITTHCFASQTGAPTKTQNSAMALEQQLAKGEKVDVYSIYFSFNSDEIREESGPQLKEIADVMRKHPDWKLRIAGHTDGVGHEDKNLDLSKRRAASVKNALVSRYHIPADHLVATGFGKTQPKDTNDTIDGRAHNRRVELMKIS